jgi:hypothetical protein
MMTWSLASLELTFDDVKVEMEICMYERIKKNKENRDRELYLQKRSLSFMLRPLYPAVNCSYELMWPKAVCVVDCIWM